MSARVERVPADGRKVTMVRGLDRASAWEEPRFLARVYDERGHLLGHVGNSSILCLPGGSVRAPEATDEQILEAVLGDESVYKEVG